MSEDTKDLIAGLWDTFRTTVLLALPWTRPKAMRRCIALVADANNLTDVQSFALMYDEATPGQRVMLAPYRPQPAPDPDVEEVSWDDPA